MYFLQVLVVALAAGLLTRFLTYRIQRGPVLSSAVVTVAAGLLLPVLFPQGGGTLVPVAACASYVGMSSENRLGKLWQMVLALSLAAVLYVASSSIFNGIGGKGGTIAAISVIAVWGSFQIILAHTQDIS
jgi:hypothetical protein